MPILDSNDIIICNGGEGSITINCLPRYAASVGAQHFTTSAKQNRGIQELFLDLSKSEHILSLLNKTGIIVGARTSCQGALAIL